MWIKQPFFDPALPLPAFSNGLQPRMFTLKDSGVYFITKNVYEHSLPPLYEFCTAQHSLGFQGSTVLHKYYHMGYSQGLLFTLCL